MEKAYGNIVQFSSQTAKETAIQFGFRHYSKEGLQWYATEEEADRARVALEIMFGDTLTVERTYGGV